MFDFPNVPTTGQTVTGAGGQTYRYDGAKWAPSGTPPVAVIVSDTPPLAPSPGQLWYDSANTMLMLYENDGNSTQWVVANNQNVLPDAPNDGRLYGRQSAGWQQAAPAATLNNVGRNLIHNPLMAIQQRGQGPWTATGYTVDRWLLGLSSDTVSATVQSLADADRAAIGDETAQSAVQVVFTGSASAGAFNQISQRMENTRRFGNKQFTASFWARATSGTPKIGVAMSQTFGTGGSPSGTAATVLGATAPLSSTWVRYSLTGTLPSTSGKTFGTTGGTDFTNLGLLFSEQNNTTGIGVQSGTIQLWGVQLEIGSVATPLDYGGSTADQLRQCQRFYQTGNFQLGGYTTTGVTASVTNLLPVLMRATPTVTPNYTTGTNTSGSVVNPVGGNALLIATNVSATGGFVLAGTFTASADL